MRPLTLAACVLALVLLSRSAWAQVAAPTPSDASSTTPAARTVIDAVFWATPGEDNVTCLQLPPGHLMLILRLEAVGESLPVRYRFAPYWYRATDSPPEIDIEVTRAPRTIEATLAGGRYCYSFRNEGGPPTDTDVSRSIGQAQLVALRMLLTP